MHKKITYLDKNCEKQLALRPTVYGCLIVMSFLGRFSFVNWLTDFSHKNRVLSPLVFFCFVWTDLSCMDACFYHVLMFSFACDNGYARQWSTVDGRLAYMSQMMISSSLLDRHFVTTLVKLFMHDCLFQVEFGTRVSWEVMGAFLV